MRGTVLRKRCTVSVPWSCQVDATFSIVVSNPRSHHRLGASQLRMLGKWRRGTHGDHAIALREVIFAYHLPQVRLLMLLLIGGYFARKIGAVSRVSVRFLTVDSPSRVKYADGPSTTSYGLDNCKEWSKRLLRRAPSSTARGHCRLTPSSRRCRALW